MKVKKLSVTTGLPVEDTKKESESDILEVSHILANMPTFGESIYKRLPDVCHDWLKKFKTEREKDVFLNGMFTASGAYFSRTTKFKHFGDYIHTNIYTFTTAPSSAGKRHIKRALAMFSFEDAIREREYQNKLAQFIEWQEEKHDNALTAKKPTKEVFFLPDTTDANLLDKIKNSSDAGKGTCILFEEADAFINNMRGKYGEGKSYILRNAFDHSTLTTATKTDDNLIKIDRPKLSVCLAGTLDQPQKMFSVNDNDTNGLLQRFVFYIFYIETKFKAGFGEGQEKDEDLYSFFSGYSDFFITHGEREVEFYGTKEQMQRFEVFFNHIISKYSSLVEDISSFVNRMASTALRIIMILERLNHRYDVALSKFSDDMFNLGLDIMEVYIHHTFTCFSLLIDSGKKFSAKGVEKWNTSKMLEDFKKSVGDSEFSTSEFREFAKAHKAGMGKSKENLNTILSRSKNKGILINAGYGKYKFR